MTQTKIFNDNWTLYDHIGHKEHVESLAEIVKTCEPPFVIGIHGDWGAGKTSFLRKFHLYFAGNGCGYKDADDAYQQLWKKECPAEHETVETVWFDAWNYQFESNPVDALLNEIRAQFTLSRKFLKKAEKTAYAALMSLDDLGKKIGVSPEKIISAGEKWEKEHFSQPLPSQLLTEMLEKAIDDLLGNEKRPEDQKKRMVIFVDDLDRCTAPVAFRFLEAMKIYLSLSNCVFVLGMDVRHIRRAVAAELKKTGVIPEPDANNPVDKSEFYASDYLGKIFQNVFYLPTVTNYKKYLDHLMKGTDLTEPDKWIDLISEYRLLPSNPRKIKTFVSSLAFSAKQVQKAIETYNAEKKPEDETLQPDRELCLIVLYLRTMANDVYRILETEPDFWKTLKRYCISGDPENNWALRKFTFPEKYDAKQAETGNEYSSAYPDPSDEALFRAAKLIRRFRAGESPTEDELNVYLLRRMS